MCSLWQKLKGRALRGGLRTPTATNQPSVIYQLLGHSRCSIKTCRLDGGVAERPEELGAQESSSRAGGKDLPPGFGCYLKITGGEATAAAQAVIRLQGDNVHT